MQDPIKLKHFGLHGILQKIDMMEGEYDIPMRFDHSRIPSVPTAAGQNIGEWGYGVAVYGTARGHHWAQETPSLMADMYAFGCKEEMAETKEYLRAHGNYQLEQVGTT